MADDAPVVRTRKFTPLHLAKPQSETNSHVLALKEYVDQQQLIDPFKDHYSDGALNGALSLIEPTYSFYSLMKLPHENSMLGQCIDAMVTNVDGHGHRLYYVGPKGQENSRAAKAEKAALDALFDYPNDDYSFHELRERLRRDYETLGNAYIEVGRDRRGRIVMMSHLPAHTMRLSRRDSETTRVSVTLPRDGSRTQLVRKRFRRFVQIVGSRRVYFKEFGDPRPIDPQTGMTNPGLGTQDTATEVIHICRYTPGSPYGLPRWFNQLPAVMGGRQAELTNLDFFKENAIPAMVLLVSGGLATEESIQALEASFRQARGRGANNRIAIVEVGGDPSNAPENGTIPVPKVELRPLHGERQNDALFQEYEKNNAAKVRSSFRLPPIFLGLSEDYTFATARTSFEVGEGQVFRPERKLFDEMINMKIVASYNAVYWQFRSMPPRLAAREDIIRAVNVFERVGALTPNVSIAMANEFFDLEIKPINDTWGNYPFSLIQLMVQTNQLAPEEVGEFGKLFKALPSPGTIPEGDQTDQGGRPDGVGTGEGDDLPIERADALALLHDVTRAVRALAEDMDDRLQPENGE